MEIIETTIYQCSYCRKYYIRKYYCERHEKQCSNNPNNWHKCYDCKNLKVWRELDNKPDVRGIKKFMCKITRKSMHTCKAESRGFAKHLNTIRMPLECDMYECIIDLEF